MVKQLVTRGLAIVVILEVAAVGIRYSLQVILARLAGPEGYGTYTYALTWAQTLTIPAGLGLASVVIRYVPTYLAKEDWQHLAGLISRTRVFTLISGLILGGLGVVATLTLSDPGVTRTTLTIAFASVPLLALATLQAETLRGGGQLFSSRIVPTVLQPLLVIATCVGVALILGELSAVHAVLCLVAATAVGVAIQQVALRRSFPRSSARAHSTREWLRVGRHLMTIKVFQLVLNSSDIILVGALLGVTSAGLYAAASKTAAMAGLISQAVNLAVPPYIARAYAEGDRSSIQRQLRWSAKIGFLPTVGLATGVILLADPVLGAFGPAFKGASDALIVLTVGRLVSALMGPVGSVLNVTGHQRINLLVYGVAALLQVALVLLLVPILGMLGAAVACSVVTVLWNAVLYVMVMRIIGVRLWPLAARRTI